MAAVDQAAEFRSLKFALSLFQHAPAEYFKDGLAFRQVWRRAAFQLFTQCRCSAPRLSLPLAQLCTLKATFHGLTLIRCDIVPGFLAEG
jgi:hypothetical protein